MGPVRKASGTQGLPGTFGASTSIPGKRFAIHSHSPTCVTARTSQSATLPILVSSGACLRDARSGVESWLPNTKDGPRGSYWKANKSLKNSNQKINIYVLFFHRVDLANNHLGIIYKHKFLSTFPRRRNRRIDGVKMAKTALFRPSRNATFLRPVRIPE
jgi:hypothetical protein